MAWSSSKRYTRPPMNEFGLKFTVPGYMSDKKAERNFYWTTSGTGSFITGLHPRLGNLGPVNPINADLVRLAVLVWAADRSVPRAKGNVNWSVRDLSLIVPVSDPTGWSAYTGDLE